VFDSTSIDTTSVGAGELRIFVTIQDITTPPGSWTFASSFTQNGLSPGLVANLQTFLDTGDGLFTTPGVAIGSASFTGPFLGTELDLATRAISGLYSITAVYDIIAGAGITGTSNATIHVSVPGPVVGAGLPGLLAACGALIALARRRKRQSALA
jgi:hypothetical protein